MTFGATHPYCGLIKKREPIMPNQRATYRKTASIVLDKETWAFLKSEAEKLGTNVSNLIEQLAKELQDEQSRNTNINVQTAAKNGKGKKHDNK